MNVDPEKSLTAAIILKAYQDYRWAWIYKLKGEEKEDFNVAELEEFFNSQWFEELCEIVQMPPQSIREKVAKIRSKYEKRLQNTK